MAQFFVSSTRGQLRVVMVDMSVTEDRSDRYNCNRLTIDLTNLAL
jgi:hypothetical protein